jgi:hypothetical protein
MGNKDKMDNLTKKLYVEAFKALCAGVSCILVLMGIWKAIHLPGTDWPFLLVIWGYVLSPDLWPWERKKNREKNKSLIEAGEMFQDWWDNVELTNGHIVRVREWLDKNKEKGFIS